MVIPNTISAEAILILSLQKRKCIDRILLLTLHYTLVFPQIFSTKALINDAIKGENQSPGFRYFTLH